MQARSAVAVGTTIELEPLALRTCRAQLAAARCRASPETDCAQAEEGANAGNPADFFESHVAFFRKVWELSGNKYLYQTLERLVVPLFVFYLTRVSFECEALMQNALVCADGQEQILETIQAGNVCEVKRMVSDYLIQMKAIIVSKGGSL
jgi:DNA-binding GntR family transcriptional regulator